MWSTMRRTCETYPKRWDLESLRNVSSAGSVGSFEFVKKTSVETSRRRWKLMVGKDEPEIHANHGETARSSDLQLTDFQALIVNVAGEDFCYTFHEMRERPVKINSNLQEDRGNNPTKILIIHIHLYHSYVVWQLLCTGWCNSPPKARGKVGITFSLSTSNMFNQPG